MIIIESKREGFRRCGIPHSKTPVKYSDDYFSESEIKILESEPMLKIQKLNAGVNGVNGDGAPRIDLMRVVQLRQFLMSVSVPFTRKDKKKDLRRLAQEYLDEIPF